MVAYTAAMTPSDPATATNRRAAEHLPVNAIAKPSAVTKLPTYSGLRTYAYGPAVTSSGASTASSRVVTPEYPTAQQRSTSPAIAIGTPIRALQRDGFPPSANAIAGSASSAPRFLKTNARTSLGSSGMLLGYEVAPEFSG